jgi:GDP-4-dehydro-6-deoxy-D-mannose reductase
VRVLVTGIEGFVGGHVAERLTELGHEVWGTCLDHPPANRPRWRRCDVRELDQVQGALRTSGAEAVVHLAARSSVADSHADPHGTYVVNVVGALNVLESAHLAGLSGPVLLVGSGEVYGRVDDSWSLAEDAPLRPLSAYAGSKAAQEVLGAQYARTFGMRVILARSFAHTGPGQDARFVFPSLARQLAGIERDGGRGVLRVGNLTLVRDYLDVRDVARAYAVLLERAHAGAVLNVCSGEGFALRDLLDEMIELSDAEIEVQEDPELVREIEIERLVGDPRRLVELGWRPVISKHEMLADLLDYWRARI